MLLKILVPASESFTALSVVMRTAPAFPVPEVLLTKFAPPDREKELAVMIILPALPIVPASLSLKIALINPSELLPDISTSPSTSISTFPALP